MNYSYYKMSLQFVPPLNPNVRYCHNRRYSSSSSSSSSDDDNNDDYLSVTIPTQSGTSGALTFGAFDSRGYDVTSTSIKSRSRRRNRRNRDRKQVSITLTVTGGSTGGPFTLTYTGSSNASNPLISATLTVNQTITLSASLLVDMSNSLSFTKSGTDVTINSGNISI